MRKQLYVWTDFNPDYTSGLAFALARTVEEAKALVIAANGEPHDWGDLKVYPISTAPFAFAVSGGG